MAYRYIALLGAACVDDPTRRPLAAAALRDHGLEEHRHGNHFRLFAAENTPLLDTPCGGVLVGCVFHRDGRRIDDSSQLPQEGDPQAFRTALTHRCWGDYVLLQETRGPSPATVVSRDPSCGIACYYATDSERRFITSDVALASHLGLFDRAVDWDTVAQLLVYTFVKSSRTALQGLRELLPGCSLHLGQGDDSLSHTWSPWDFVSPRHHQPGFEEAASNLRGVIDTVVRSWSRVDGSILVELSGGLDSSIIAACLGRTSSHVVCATLVTALPGADERRYAGAIATHAGLPLRSLALTAEHSCVDPAVAPWLVMPRAGPLQQLTDEIVRDTTRREGLRASYSGGGGDTVFSYLTSAAPAADAFIKQGPIAGLKAIRDLSELHHCTLWLAARLTLKKLRTRHPGPAAADWSFLKPATVDPPDAHPWLKGAAEQAPGDRERVTGLIGTQVLRDGLPRSAVSWLRLPLLSQPVMEACLAIPSWMWISGGINRAVARAAFADALPASVAQRRSKGDFLQLCAAIYRHNQARIGELLLCGELAARGLLDVDALRAFLDPSSSARGHAFMRIFDLCSIENWIRHQR
ncbi:asparagine synthase C-terminal domain-containing protein [Stenotrophomonas mori]|uniref:asparagine synthase (glutamine-hydrolyzing) n=1 Tax=Stenotrophomonas mori TaxID=2871096 RepID=A0ABT0SI24_9GAMM|nr:asparagine synthase C-terminal domain-containing protein [Stenotrophomonas mori]MCL7714974.1 asparagine synthase C-terminal domain-containing protein [Stenotrophomonas mori]